MKWINLLDKRGQIRGIDFAVAAFFFVIVLGQLVVVILNANILIVEQRETNTTKEDLLEFANLIFESEGNPNNWGNLYNQAPDYFGLALQELATTGFELDPTKLARLNADSVNIPGYSNFYINYETLHDLLGLENDMNFHLAIRTPLNLTMETNDKYTVL